MIDQTLVIACSRCGGTAATFVLRPAEAGGEDRYALERAGFMSITTLFGTREDLSTVFDAIGVGEWMRLEGRHGDLAAFRCRLCGEVYCERCWSVGEPLFEDGFYDCTPATCPRGHEQTVDD
jgi:hypothetical protein